MGMYKERLRGILEKRMGLSSRGEGIGGFLHGYEGIWREEPRKRTLGEEFLEELEKEGDFERVFEKFVKKGTQRPGTTKEKVKNYLARVLLEAREEGRI